MAERGLRGVPEKAPVARAPRIGETSKSISGTKSAVTLKKAPSVQKSIDAKIQAIEETEAEVTQRFSIFSSEARSAAPKTPQRAAGRSSIGRLSSGPIRTPTREEQQARTGRSTPSKDHGAAPSSVLRPTAASLLRQQRNAPNSTPTRVTSASSTPVKMSATPSRGSSLSTPTSMKTPQIRSTPTRAAAPPAALRATPNRNVRSTPTRPPMSAKKAPAATTSASQASLVSKKPAVPAAGDAKVEARSEAARLLLEAREELQRLMNVLLQMVLANAKASAAFNAQEERAEAELFTEWNQLEVLRKELTTARHKLNRDTHTLDLRLLLNTQAEQAAQASEWLPQYVAAYAALTSALEHTTHLMPAPNVLYNAATVLSAFNDTSNALQNMEQASLSTSNVSDASGTVSRLASVLRDEEAELARLQELLTMHSRVENYERSLRIQAIQAK